MRIDVTAPPQVLGLTAAPAQPGHTLPFDAFFSAPQGQDGEGGTQTKAAPVLSQYVFGFDAVGMLGLGGPAGVGKPFKAVAEDAPAAGPQGGQRPSHPVTGTVQAPAAPAYAYVPYTAFSSSPRPEAPQATPVADLSAKPARPAQPVAMQTSGAVSWTPAAQSRPVAAGQVQIVSASSAVAAVDRPFASGPRAFRSDTAKDAEAPRKTQATFRFEPEAEAAGQVGVTVSEGEDLLHVVAAAPGLTDGDRQVLKAVADEAAAEAGITLGELRLNGVVVRQLSKTR